MAEPAPEEGFKVTDRRRRHDAPDAAGTGPGRPVESAPEESSASRIVRGPRDAPAPGPRGAPSASRIVDPSRPPSSQSRPPEPRSGSAPASAAEPQRDLTGLFMMLASEAVIALGDAADPVTGERHRELPHAAALIDLLALLREKTEGHRSLEETQVLEELIYDLQMRYVRASRPA